MSRTDGHAVLVLAGGQSTRFGRDKAEVAVDGVRALDRVLAAVSGVGPVWVSGPVRETAQPVAGFIPDQEVGQGPFHAMICGFEAIDAHEILVVSCDQPWLSPEAAGFLAEPLPEGVDARVPRMDGKFQVLTALYRRAVLAQMKEAWIQGVRSPTRFLDALSVRSVTAADFETRGIDPCCLLDFDTAQDLNEGGSANK